MPLTPDSATRPNKRGSRLRQRFWIGLFAVFAFEIGAFLAVFPWMDSWSLNHLPTFFPTLQSDFQDVWDEPSFRAAFSALGILNLLIAVRQVIELLRIGRPSNPY